MYKRKKTLHQCLIVALMLVLCVIFLVPILWVFFSSFKSASELFV